MTQYNFRALCAELVEAFKDENTYTQRVEILDRARAALATPPPLAPNYIDPEHHGEDRELLQVFYAACNAEGGTADEIHLRGIRAVMAAPAALATPPPEPPTNKELQSLWHGLFSHDNTVSSGDVEAIVRAALERWGK